MTCIQEHETTALGRLAGKRCDPGEFVREDRISTQGLPAKQQFSAWCKEIAFLADVSVVDEAQAQAGYLAEARGYDLGKLVVASISADACGFRRGVDHIRRNGMDHWVLSYRSSGSFSSRCGGNALRADSPSLSLISLAYPFKGEADAGSSISLFIERDHLLPFAAQLDRLNHTVLQGITAGIAIEFLTCVTRLLPATTIAEIPVFVETALIVLKGFAEQASLSDFNPSRPVLAVRLEMVKRYIQENLTSDSLEPDDICAAMKLSRRQLYYLFEQIGGVSSYIRSRRLMAFHEAIADPAEARPIHTVAASFGFHDAALFSRQFKAQFGYSPKEARDTGLLGYAPLTAPPQTVAEWLGQVRGAD